VKLKKESYESLTVPVCAFITFQEEEGLQTACRFQQSSNTKNLKNPHLLGVPFWVQAATEPTNIIWENRELTTLQIVLRTFKVLFYCSVLLVVSFVVIFMCQQYSVYFQLKYPPVDCKEVQKTFKDSLLNVAYQEFMNYYHNKHEPQPLTGNLSCFC